MNTDLCLFNEGSVTIPQGFVDRTINIIADAQAQQPPVNISRDKLPVGMALDDYINSQISELQRSVQGWEGQIQAGWVLGDNVCTGIGLDHSFLRPDGVRICQKQAIFDVGDGTLLLFSSSKTSGFSAAEEACFQQVIASFTPRGA